VNGSRSTPGRRRFRLAALIVAAICVLALAAGVFALAYPGARDTALNAGVTVGLARIYPGIFDAVLLVAWAAALSLRGALRGYAWLAILVVIAAVAAADATHAMSVALPRRPMEATVAVVPWVVLLVGFTLLYAMVRQARPGHAVTQPADQPPVSGLPGTPGEPGNGRASRPGTTVVPLSELLAARTGPAADRARPGRESGAIPPPAATTPKTATTTPGPAPATPPATTTSTTPGPTPAAERAATGEPAVAAPPPTAPAEPPAGAEPADPAAGFSRVRSSPTPPEDAPAPTAGPSGD
jgi:hypothetical protein